VILPAWRVAEVSETSSLDDTLAHISAKICRLRSRQLVPVPHLNPAVSETAANNIAADGGLRPRFKNQIERSLRGSPESREAAAGDHFAKALLAGLRTQRQTDFLR
jgi:hypothetical protein